MNLDGKTAIVTGAASGFGAGIARSFAAEGAKVMVVDLDIDAAQAVATDIAGIAHRADVSNGDQVSDMIETAIARMDHVDILVNNAGVTHLPGALEDISEDDFDRVFAANCKSVYLAARKITPPCSGRWGGSL